MNFYLRKRPLGLCLNTSFIRQRTQTKAFIRQSKRYPVRTSCERRSRTLGDVLAHFLTLGDALAHFLTLGVALYTFPSRIRQVVELASLDESINHAGNCVTDCVDNSFIKKKENTFPLRARIVFFPAAVFYHPGPKLQRRAWDS